MKNERLTYLDNAKGILIIMMVFGHVFLDDVLVPVVNWISAFHMPAFFIINGILFHYSRSLQKPFWKSVLHFVYSILIPLVFSEAVGALCYNLRFGFTQNIFGFAYNTLHYHFNNGPDWFLVVLFVADVLFVALHKLVRNVKIQVAICALTMVIAFLLPQEWFIVRSMGISFGCVCIGFYAHDWLTNLEKSWTLLVTFVISVIITWVNGGKGLFDGGVSLNIARVNNPVLWTIGAIAGTYFVLFAGKKLNPPGLSYIGQNSLIVMITHQLIMLPIRHYTGVAEFNLWQGTIVLILTVALQFPLCWFINRFLPFCVGRKFPQKKNTVEQTESAQ